jgi:hypothetical protein
LQAAVKRLETILAVRNAVRVKQLGALARFALFAGVGYKTTQGLGVTRFVTPKILEPEPNTDGVHPAWTV